ncbi:MAG TPA: guanylate kinase [Candidatus Paceibacterota bacterium]
MARGKLIIVIGPMGSGKGSLIRHASEHFPDLGILPSYTSRPKRPDHVEGSHYRFISLDEFKAMIERDEFLERATFSDNYYGTRKQDLEDCLTKGKVVIKEMEVQGVRQVKQLLPKEDLITIFINAGPWEELKDRAIKRDHMSEEELARRKERYDDEVTFMPEADLIIENRTGEREKADQAFEAVISEAISNT